MNELKLTLSADLLFSAVFSLLIFSYLQSFSPDKPALKIHKMLFLSFVLASFTEVWGAPVSGKSLLTWAFLLFFTFSFFTYKKFGENRDYFYFIQILFYSANILVYLLIAKNNSLIINISSSGFLEYLPVILAIALSISHKLKNSNNSKVLFTYILGASYFGAGFFAQNVYLTIISKISLLLFFFLHFLNSQEQVYKPLLQKIQKMETQLSKAEAEMPEHIQKKIQILENNKAKLMDMANTDKMTGVLNKSRIVSIIRDLTSNEKIDRFSILMFDIDNFKNINDISGHLVGDECIFRLAKIGERSIRKNDFIGRYGGDEFLIILPRIGSVEAKVIAERFRIKVAQESEPHFTISIGLSSYPEDGKTFRELLSNADKALYLSKERGKNKVSHVNLF